MAIQPARDVQSETFVYVDECISRGSEVWEGVTYFSTREPDVVILVDKDANATVACCVCGDCDVRRASAEYQPSPIVSGDTVELPLSSLPHFAVVG